MDINLKEICENLKDLSNSLRIKRECEIALRQKEESYIKRNVELQEPKKKPIHEVYKPEKPSMVDSILFDDVLLAVAIVCGCIGLGSFLMFIFMEATDSIFIGLIGGAIGFILPIYIGNIPFKRKAEYYKALDQYEKTLIENEKNKKYNESFSELMNNYKKEVLECKQKFQYEQEKYKKRLAEAEKIIEKYGDIISSKFYEDINEIVDIIEDGRADSLKEAINMFISDCRQEDLIRAQQESNIIAEQQRLDAERHNMEMEEQARRQTDAIRRQTDAIKKQEDAIREQEDARRRRAPKCLYCRNHPCGGDPAYCGSFVKK